MIYRVTGYVRHLAQGIRGERQDFLGYTGGYTTSVVHMDIVRDFDSPYFKYKVLDFDVHTGKPRERLVDFV